MWNTCSGGRLGISGEIFNFASSYWHCALRDGSTEKYIDSTAKQESEMQDRVILTV